MLSRRSFLLGSATLSIAHLLAGCQSQDTNLRAQILAGSIPPQLINSFRSSLKTRAKLSFQPQPQLKDLLTLLENWANPETNQAKSSNWFPWNQPKTPPYADLVTLGDAWLATAITQKLIRPLELSKLSGWEKLPPRWRHLVQRNSQGMIEPNGEIWAAPYRWGTTVIAYDQDRFRQLGWLPTDWDDLWREELAGHISLLDQPREVIGLTLKKLGYSYNATNLSQITPLKSELEKLNRQVKFYSSEYYLQPLILGDTWLAQGWSSDLIPLQERYSNIKIVIPQSGTSLWADVWVQPIGAENKSDLSQEWINFCWQSQSANQISLFTNGASPLILSEDRNKVPDDILHNPLLFIDERILGQSEFLYPLSSTTEQEYNQLWQEIRVKSHSQV